MDKFLLQSVLFTFYGMAVSAEMQMPKAPGTHIGLKPEDIEKLDSFKTEDKIIGTYFFYWYDIYSKSHIVNPDGSDAMVDHPKDSEDFSYKSPRWWKKELLDVMSAGIDFILPVYWGNPSDREPGKGLYWSFEGLDGLVKAENELVRDGKKPPKIGLFYDTSTLQYNSARIHVDLSTDFGKAWFYATIRDFFSLIPPSLWAMLERQPIVVLYSPAFAKKQDEKLFDYVKERFNEDFGCSPFIVKELGWEGKADAEYSWGGAIKPVYMEKVAAFGPGYDHHAVPGRKPMVVSREEGEFYRKAWEKLLSMSAKTRPKIVLIETWNELHEGTDICETKEYGREYIEMTAKFAKLFK